MIFLHFFAYLVPNPSPGHQGQQGHQPPDDDDDEEEDNEVEDNNKDDDNKTKTTMMTRLSQLWN